ncbi:MAG: hypothetical protein HY259_02780 [Chloroflexi bacterium]|nr:hypothetical protein [Chloroflexota bacterium]
MQRLTPITIVAALALTAALVEFAGALTLLGLLEQGGDVAFNLGVFLLLAALANALFAYSAWRRRTWAWTFGLMVQVFSLLLSSINLYGSPDISRHWVNILLALLIVWYLLRSSVKQAFGRS